MVFSWFSDNFYATKNNCNTVLSSLFFRKRSIQSKVSIIYYLHRKFFVFIKCVWICNQQMRGSKLVYSWITFLSKARQPGWSSIDRLFRGISWSLREPDVKFVVAFKHIRCPIDRRMAQSYSRVPFWTRMFFYVKSRGMKAQGKCWGWTPSRTFPKMVDHNAFLLSSTLCVVNTINFAYSLSLQFLSHELSGSTIIVRLSINLEINVRLSINLKI